MALTTLANVKAFKGGSGGERDGELTRLIAAVGAFVAAYCRRTFETATVTEYHNGRSGQRRLLLRQPPITSITSIHDDVDRSYGSTTLIASTDYVITDAAAGLVDFDGGSLQEGLSNIKVIYVGGYAATAIPADLEQAAIELVWLAAMKGQENLLGLSAKNISDGAISIVNLNWPAHLLPILDHYRLPDLGWD